MFTDRPSLDLNDILSSLEQVHSDGSAQDTPPADASSDEFSPPPGMTPQEWARLHGGDAGAHAPVLHRGVDWATIFAPDQEGLNCLHTAVMRGDVQFLLDLRAERVPLEYLLARNAGGSTAIHMAAAFDDRECFEALLTEVPDASRLPALCAVDDEGSNTLHFAVLGHGANVIPVLGREMANQPGGIGALMTRDHEGKSPADLAVEQDSPEMLRALAEAGVPEQQLLQAYVRHRQSRVVKLDWRSLAAPAVTMRSAGGTGAFGVRPMMRIHQPQA